MELLLHSRRGKPREGTPTAKLGKTVEARTGVACHHIRKAGGAVLVADGPKHSRLIAEYFSFGPRNNIFIGTYRGYVRFSSAPDLPPNIESQSTTSE